MLQVNAWRIAAAVTLILVIAAVIFHKTRSAPGDRDSYVVRASQLPALPITLPQPVIPAGAIVLEEGQDVQAAVDAGPANTAFLLKAGTYRLQSIVPKDGDSFFGEPGAVLNGSHVLTDFNRETGLWMAIDTTKPGQAAGYCSPGYGACAYPEDLFLNDEMLRRVMHRDDVGPGRWYFDEVEHKVYLSDDPRGQKVEISETRSAFSGNAKNVGIRGLVVEKYAQPGQFGAIDGSQGTNWTIEGNDVRFNHAAGVVLGSMSTLRGNLLHHNGQLGVKGGGEWSTIEGNVIAYNNTAGFDAGWEAGGGKFSQTTKLTVRNNIVSNNYGTGLWTDIDNKDVLYEDNVIKDNSLRGIFHEISYDAVIRNNQISGNGLGFDDWLWGGQIVIANSSNVDVYDNDVTVPSNGGDGITLVQANRGAGKYGTWLTKNDYVHDNDIHYLGSSGQSGAGADFDQKGMLAGNNRFDRNRYYVTDSAEKHWSWMVDLDWQGFRAKGQEAHGNLSVVSDGQSREGIASKP